MLNCFPCFCDGWKFIKQSIALYLWQSVDSIVISNDGRLSTLLKCSAHLFKIASLSVRIVLPYALSKGVWHQNFWAINCFQCIMELLHILSVYKRLNFFCFLAQPGVLHVTEPALDCLTNIVVGSHTELVSS